MTPEKEALLRDMRRVATFFGATLIGGAIVTFLGLWCRYHICDALIGILWSAALAACGMFGGFLFGVPKVVQSRGIENHQSGGQVSPSASPTLPTGQVPPSGYTQRVNTNLEEISDWLTKIIVGIGLIELRNAPAQILRLATQIGTSFPQASEDRVGIATALIIFFSISGFLFGYLLTRLFLQGALGRADRDALLNEYARELGTTQRALAKASTVLKENNPNLQLDVGHMGSLAAQFERVWWQDPNKGGFGGQSVVGNRRLSAVITPISDATSPAICQIRLTVESTNPQTAPLGGDVVFHLHPTFNPAQRKVTVVNGLAVLDLHSAGRFTVGAEADNGDTRLELDLVDVPGGTPEFYKN